jgi:hypothetical protein
MRMFANHPNLSFLSHPAVFSVQIPLSRSPQGFSLTFILQHHKQDALQLRSGKLEPRKQGINIEVFRPVGRIKFELILP